MITYGTCSGCGERIGQISVCTRPMETQWLHGDWQHKYDHLPNPTESHGIGHESAEQPAAVPEGHREDESAREGNL